MRTSRVPYGSLVSQAKPRPRRRWLRRLALLVGLLVVNVLGGIGDLELGADVVGNVFAGTPKIAVNLHGSSGK